MNESDEPQSPPPPDKDGLSALVEEILAEREAQSDTDVTAEQPAGASEFLFDIPADDDQTSAELPVDDAGNDAAPIDANQVDEIRVPDASEAAPKVAKIGRAHV